MVTGDNEVLQWDPTDDNPGNYTLYLNGTIESEGPWTEVSGINYSLDLLIPGEYVITIFVYDESLNYITDTV